MEKLDGFKPPKVAAHSVPFFLRLPVYIEGVSSRQRDEVIHALEKAGVKTLFLEFDVTVPNGQFKVRVEAFLEMLNGEDLF